MASLVKIPVAVVIERREVVQGRWRVPAWAAVSILPGGHLTKKPAGSTLIRQDDEAEQYLISGLKLELYRDSAESYWYNLTGENAALYVICHENPEGGLDPFLVTADRDEAMAGLEGDAQVFSTPISPEIYHQIEQFILEHYVPEAPRKRKRKNWSDKHK